MSSNQSTTTAAPGDEPITEQLLTGLRQCLAITELLSLHHSGNRFSPAWDVLTSLLEQMIALAYLLNNEQ